MRRAAAGWVIAIALVGAVLLLLNLDVLFGNRCSATNLSDTLSSGHAIRLALERYAADYGTYPEQIPELQTQQYLPILPRNAYVRGREEPRTMQAVASGSMARTGDFLYLPLRDGQGYLRDYRLYVFGADRERIEVVDTD